MTSPDRWINFQPEDSIGSSERSNLEGHNLRGDQFVSKVEKAKNLNPGSEDVGDTEREMDGREADEQKQQAEIAVSAIIADLDERELRLRRGELGHLREGESKSGISFMVEVELDQAIKKAEGAGANVGELRERQTELRNRIAKLDSEFPKE